LTNLGPLLDEMHEKVGAPLLARRGLAQAWADAFTDWEPWVFALVDGGDVRAIAPLARRRMLGGTQVVSLGYDSLDLSPISACDDESMIALAAELRRALDATRRPWALRLRRLPADSPFLSGVSGLFPTSTVTPGSGRPVTRFEDGRDARSYLTRNTRNAYAKAQNRICRERGGVDVRWVDGWSDIEPFMPEVVRIHRDRDLELRGWSLLDDADQARFYRGALESHTEDWRLLVVTIDDSVAAYALCLQDGSVLRVWDNRVAPEWRRYSAGLIANVEVVRFAAEAAFDAVDWGCGEQRYKASMATDVVPSADFVAWSSRLCRAVLKSRRAVIERFRTQPEMAVLALSGTSLLTLAEPGGAPL
jgi:CelD/BcsL family acetyltransferase involved in cellulose biosynthesis